MTVQAAALTALAAAADQFERAAEALSRAGAGPAPGGDRVDLSTEMAALLAARAAFQTAVKLVQTADETVHHTLDILA